MNFINGIVTELGFGYEESYSEGIGGFFYGKGYHSVYIQDVDFNWNFAFIGEKTPYPGLLFYSEEFSGQIKFINCNFDYNFMNQLIYIDVSMLVYEDAEIDNLVSKAYGQLHFEMKNVRFNNTFCSDTFFTYLMLKTVQNIEISNVAIDNVIVGDGELFHIESNGILTDTDKVGAIYSIILNFVDPIYYYMPPRYIKIVNFTISDVTAGEAMFKIVNIPNLILENVKIYNVADGYKKNIDDLIDIFASNSQYLSDHIEPDRVPNLKCMQVTSLTSIYELSLKNIEIHSTSCTKKSGAAGLFISSIENKVSLENINIHDITGTSVYAIALYISDALLVQVNDLNIQNVFNNDGGVVELHLSKNINVSILHVENIASSHSSALLFNNIEILKISEYSVIDSSTSYGNGGCIGVISSNNGLNASISDGVLTRCEALSGLGGGIFIDSLSTRVKVLIYLNMLVLSQNKAKDGALIYVSSRVVFYDDLYSEFTHVTGTNSDSSKGGIIADNHEMAY